MLLNKNLIFAIFTLWWSSVLPSFAKEIKDTLMSSSNDRVYIKYDIDNRNEQISISFTEVRIQLGPKYRDKYDELNKIFALFFEKGGGYKDNFISDIGTEPITVNSDEVRYQKTADGYMRLDDRTIISLELLTEQAILSFPIYLAHYEGKQKYKIFTKCQNLNVKLKKRKYQNGQTNIKTETINKEIQITEQVEVGSDITPTQEVELLIENIRENMGQENSSKDTLKKLEKRIERLRELEIIIPDKKIQAEIQNVLQTYDTQLLIAQQQEDVKDSIACEDALRQKEEKQARQDLAYIQERLENIKNLSESDLGELKSCSNELRKKSHSIENKELAKQMKDTAEKCDSEIKKIENLKSKHRILLIISGILLCILMFIGNQIFQHFRNIRNIKSMEDAQNKMAKRAQDEARRRTQSVIRSKTNRIQGQVRQKSRDAVRNTVKKNVNNVKKGIGINKKGLSI